MFAVIFEVVPKPDRRDEYLGFAAFLRPELEKIDGFLDVERFAGISDKDRVLSLSLWRDEKAVIRWRTLAAHHLVQAKGRDGIFRDYHLRVGEVFADTSLRPGETLAGHRFDATETGAAKVVSISETSIRQRGAAAAPPAAGGDGVPDPALFESIYNPGKQLLLGSWPDAGAAAAWRDTPPEGTWSRHLLVRVIRDYGMFDRREAPQYYPPAAPPPA